jgi:Tfp pilus assembly protein PilF
LSSGGLWSDHGILEVFVKVNRMKSCYVTVVVLAFIACFGCAALEASKKKASYHYQMGLSFLAEGNYTRALVELTEAEKLTPDDPNLLNYLGQAYFFKKKYELAEQKYLHALEYRPSFSEVRNNLGVDYLEMKRWDDAIKQLTIVTNDIFYQNIDDANMNLALAYFGKGDNDTALSILRPVVARNPRNPVVRFNLGRVYFSSDKVGLAVAEFKKAIDLNKNYAKAHYNLALAYLKLQDTTSARTEFREVLRIDSDSEIGQLSKEYIETLR